MTTPRCPTCRAPLEPTLDERHRPFCSSRCKRVDLGRWLAGDYRIPGPPAEVERSDPTREMQEPNDA
jgi:endogenous inhibitor of DNA gyrase (YacG/DUF329 family)